MTKQDELIKAMDTIIRMAIRSGEKGEGTIERRTALVSLAMEELAERCYLKGESRKRPDLIITEPTVGRPVIEIEEMPND